MSLLEKYELVSSEPKGLKSWCVDLHFHTPASKDSKWVEKDHFKILRMIYEAGINCVAITDHFSGNFIDKLKEARKVMSGWSEFNKKTLPTILPGVEIEVDGVHLLCILPENYGTADINFLLSKLDIKPDQYGNEEANCTVGLKTIRETVDAYGGLIVAAHANRSKGLLSIRGKNFADLASIVDIIEIAGQNFSNEKDNTQKHRPELRMKPFTQGSDSHSEDGLNKNKSLIRMQAPNFSSLRQVIFEPTTRFEIPKPETYIIGISFNSPSGIFTNQRIAFNEGMNTIIGGRGDGKSILMDSIRYVLENYPTLEYLNQAEGGMLSRIDGTFDDGDSIELFLKHKDDVYACVRVVSIEKNRRQYLATIPAKWYKLEAGDFTEIPKPEDLKFTIYSQGEIENLTREMDKIGEICDNYDNEIRATEVKIDEDLTKLDFLFSERHRIRNIQELIDAKKERNAEISADITRFETLLGDIDKSIYHKMLRADEESSNMIKDLWEVIEEMRRVGGSIVSRLDKVKARFLEDGRFINEDFEKYFNHVRNTALRISEVMTFAEIGKFRDTLERKDWKTKLDTEKIAYDTLIRNSGLETQESLMPRLKILRVQQTSLSSEIEIDSAEISRLPKVEQSIKEVIENTKKLILDLESKRKANIEILNSQIPEVSYIEYSTDKSNFKDWLDENLKSKGITEKGSTVAKLLGLSPIELLEAAITENEVALNLIGVNGQNARIVIDVVNSIDKQNLHRILSIFTPNVGLIKGEQRFQINSLSIGEKVSAVFPLLTLNTGKPILLDQPEDDLDHNYIINNITNSIKNSKLNQQFIIITHNPNIPVLADSDQIIKMKRVEENQECIVERIGAIEDNEIRSHVMKLDGGIEAIEIRYKRYKS